MARSESGAESGSGAEKALALAATLRELGWLAKAEETCRAALRDHPDHAELLHTLGVIRVQQDDRNEAKALFAAAVGRDPTKARHHISLGLLLTLTGDVTWAKACFRHALALEPANRQALIRMGALAKWERRLADALVILLRAVAIDPADPTALGHAANLHLALGDPQAAERFLRAALVRDDAAPSLYAKLGEALRRQEGRHREAADACRRALVLHPGSLDALLGLALALESLGQGEEAARDLRAAAAQFASPDALLRIGGHLFERAHEEAAAEVYSRFAALTPERARYPGNPPRCVKVRPAAEACRAQEWPYRSAAPAFRAQVTGDEGIPYVYDVPEAFLAYAEDAEVLPRVHFPLVGGDTLLVDGFNASSRASLTMVPHIVWHSADERMLLDLPEPAHMVEEDAILLGGGPNWSHGVLDWSSKLAVLERFPDLERLPVLVSADTPRSIRALYELLGLAPDRMRFLPPGEVVRARRLWLPSLAHRYQHAAPMHVEFLRRRLAGPIGEGRARPRRRIFLSRRQAGYRALTNEAEVLASLAPLGVEPVVPEDLSMAEQIVLFASAELIVGPIGGASAAVVFAPPGAGYVELAHSRIALPQYRLLTALAGQRYRQIVGVVRGNRGPLDFDFDFAVSPEAVVAAARELLRGA